jgi:hypothetical protein
MFIGWPFSQPGGCRFKTSDLRLEEHLAVGVAVLSRICDSGRVFGTARHRVPPLVAESGGITRLFRITGLDRAFTIYSFVPEAIAAKGALGGPPSPPKVPTLTSGAARTMCRDRGRPSPRTVASIRDHHTAAAPMTVKRSRR